MMRKYLLATVLTMTLIFTIFACNPTDSESSEGNGADDRTAEIDEVDNGDGDIAADAGAPQPWDSARKGFAAFQDPQLSGSENEMACQTCHPWGGKDPNPDGMAKGSLIGSAESFPKVVPMTTGMLGDDPITLVEMINFCITNPLKGNALEESDELMRNLVDFHYSLTTYSFNDDILPIVNVKCAGCHAGAVTSGHNWTDEEHLSGDASVLRENIESGEMPQIGELTDKEFLTLINWATFLLDQNDGAPTHMEHNH